MKKLSSRFAPLSVLLGSALLSTACTVQSVRGTGDYGPTAYSSDAGVAGRVKVALQSQPGINLKNIKVDTFQGMVQLSGQVDSHKQMVQTVAAVNHVDGVKTVRSYLFEAAPRPLVGAPTAVAQAQKSAPALVVVASNSSTRSATNK
ncbi:MAG: transport-associated protein [Nevskia sp.]|nr:transport-associated protein [Nevskia sp.]